ncbi:MAG: DUF4982 domain-containing protein [Candidatus Goldbacteria bacterium]|nr:DUF4982 domain-containing protein [Candidatus Goldiibacteriota bacterium]
MELKSIIFFTLIFIYCLQQRSFGLNIEIKQNPRQILLFNDDWKFQRSIDDISMSKADFNDLSWKKIRLPHDWAIEGWLPSEKIKRNIPFISVVSDEWKFNKGDNIKWKEVDFDDSNWQKVKLPAHWEKHSDYTQDNVYGWYRREIIIPKEYKGKDILINIGFIDDVDETYFNGELIGKTGSFPPDYKSAWNIPREYVVKSKLIKYGEKNIIAVRVFDGYGPGGIYMEKADNLFEGPFNRGADGGSANGFLPGGIGWYRKTFTLPKDWQNKIVFIEFDGIYMDSDVWINGHHLGNRPYGYSSFCYDLTPYLKFGKEKNIIAVRVNVKQQCTRWYSGAGIYRNVWLIKTEKVFIPQWGTYITSPEINKNEAVVKIETKIKNLSSKDTKIKLETIIFDKFGTECSKTVSDENVSASSEIISICYLKVKNPFLWSIEEPNLYTAISNIYEDDILVDSYITRFGIREIKFTDNDGFYLNGKKVQIKGVCLHHDNGYLGAAFHKRAVERQLEIMKDMGANAIRTSHNPPAPELLELCDEMGFLVMDEAFDEWRENKVIYGYRRFFDKWAEQDLISMIIRDRNHPSIVIWSIGNEIAEQWQGSAEDARKRTKFLADICHKYDPTRPVTAAFNVVENAIEKGMADGVDIFGINYNPSAYQKLKGLRKLIATETASDVSSRGVYNLVLKDGKVIIEPLLNNQVTSYDIFAPEWAYPAWKSLKAIKEAPWVYGEFVWTGFDYIGEPTPFWWPSVISYFGIVDLCGFPKDRYYLYKSQWTNEPVVHILPHWNWEQFIGYEIPVYVYTNCETVELFLNGKSLGEKKISDSQNLFLEWSVIYEPGTLLAIAKNNGIEVLRKENKTSGTPAKIELIPDRKEIKADGYDLCYVTIKILDKDGNFCPTANNRITIDVRGAGFLAATGNGNPINHAFFNANEIDAFNGMCLAIIKSYEKRGKIIIKAKAKGLLEAKIELISK